MQLRSFDAEYVERLTAGDPDIESHFSYYFGNLLTTKLRVRLHARRLMEDVRQETLLRVLEALRRRQGVEHPERFGAFVNAVCNHVMMEMSRAEARHDAGNADQPEPRDTRINLDAPLIDSEMKRQVQRVMHELPRKDRRLLEAVYLEELDKSEVCRRHGVDGDYLRVLLHRAKARFRKVYQEHAGVRPIRWNAA